MKNLYIFFFLSLSTIALAQQSDSLRQELTLSGYVDAYYRHFADDIAETFAASTTAGPRNRTIGINVGQIGLKYRSSRIRGNFTYHTGDIPAATWSSDFTQIQVANVGARLGKYLWADAGFFITHLGMEGFLPNADNLSEKAFTTFNEPFYQSGLRLSYENDAAPWYAELWLLNGLNSFVDNNDAKSLGLLLRYRLSDRESLTFTGIYGNEAAPGNPESQFLLLNNIYWLREFNDKWSVKLTGTYGVQTNSDRFNINDAAVQTGGIVTVHYQADENWGFTLRGDFYDDPSGILSGTQQTDISVPEGFTATGITFGTEYKPTAGSYLRAETRYAEVPDDSLWFPMESGDFANSRFSVLLTFGVFFDKVFGK